MTNSTLTAVEGIKVGHWHDKASLTGCTVVLCPDGTVGGVDQRGGAPGTRETDLLRPLHLVEHVNAIVLTGGSAFGLATADGVMRYLHEQEIGYPTGSGVHVPIVPASVVYDLELGQPHFPTAQNGYDAAQQASAKPVAQGNFGAGIGCRIGGLMGNLTATKGGLGGSSMTLANGLTVAALFVVNALGDVLAADGSILGGLRDAENPSHFVGTWQAMLAGAAASGGNTVIGVVATNARLTKEHTNKVAQMAHDGLARAVHPAHTLYDGDTIFALATGAVESDVNLVGTMAADVTNEAIRNAIRFAKSAGGVAALQD